MPIILLIESSTEVCSVALSSNGRILALKENQLGLSHSELLGVYIRDILKENQLSTSQLDAIAVSKGPGSYTGLRIGVSIAKGICFAAQKPLIAISSLDAMANYVAQNPKEYNLEINNNTLISPMIDARRMEVYTRMYDSKGRALDKITAKIIDKDAYSDILTSTKILFCGNGAFKCSDTLTKENAIFTEPKKASARFMLNLAEESFNNLDFVDVAYFEPYYLKDFVATIPKNKIIS